MESLPIDIDPGIPPAFELISYQDSGYRFQIIPLDADPPAGFEQLGFVDAAFDMGSAAFGSGGTCPLQTTVQSNWPANSQLLVRRLVSIPAGMGNIRILISVDNDIVDVFFNGTPITDPISHDECPVLDEFRLDVPPSLVQPGENLVAFHLLDRGVESFFNARILAGLLPGDLNADGDVDANDVALLLADRNTRVENSRCGPLCDLDSDGRITPRDAGLLRRQCTRPGCAVE